MGKSVDLVGKRFGSLTVTRKTPERDSAGCVMWECKCDCGNVRLASTNLLNRGLVKSCGCGQNKMDDLTGKRFGRLTVIGFDRYEKSSHSARWVCKCDCGKKKSVLASCLKAGQTTSCGCFASEQKSKRSRTHGIGNSDRLYRIWSGMKSRCYSQSDRNFKRYGARGIEVCQEWQTDFLSFRGWALSNGYKDDLTVDRIDNNGPYSPSNCRWVDKAVQNNNRRSNAFIAYGGTTHTISEWAALTGIKPGTLAYRKSHGWSDDECIEVPISQSNNQTTRKNRNQ